MKLLVVGSSNMDLVISLPRIPVAGETILGGKSSMVFGGKGANQAVSALRAGGDVSYIAKVGKDLFGENMIAHFKKEGFNTDLILTDDKEPTGVAQIFVSENGENSIAVAPGANLQLMPTDLLPYRDLIQHAEVVLLQLETPIATIEFIADLVHNSSVKLILNPAPAQTLSAVLLSKVWLLTPNETEASLLTGITVIDKATAENAAAALLLKGVENVLITLGEKGCLLYNESGANYFQAFTVKAVDTTAAGDVFNGSLAVAITQGASWKNAIRFAAAAAALSVTKEGAQPSIPHKSEIEHFLNTVNP
ncbi:MAG: ribokinase [Flavobacteriaceae bacterium]|nr:MAG: ribokinase [Flavobacteriaceae bacterium]